MNTSTANTETAQHIADHAAREHTSTLIAAIADAGEALDLSGSDTDVIDIVLALRPLMAPSLWAPIADAWEICPTHGCDEKICADDDADCEAGQA